MIIFEQVDAQISWADLHLLSVSTIPSLHLLCSNLVWSILIYPLFIFSTPSSSSVLYLFSSLLVSSVFSSLSSLLLFIFITCSSSFLHLLSSHLVSSSYLQLLYSSFSLSVLCSPSFHLLPSYLVSSVFSSPSYNPFFHFVSSRLPIFPFIFSSQEASQVVPHSG